MPSDVGRQAQEFQVIEHAVALEMDCVTAFTEAAKQTEQGPSHENFARLAAECAEHVRLWQQQLQQRQRDPAKPNRVTAWLNRFKVQVVAPLGHRAIAFAVTNNAVDCVTAYKRVASREDLQPATRALASRMLQEASAQCETVRAARQ